VSVLGLCCLFRIAAAFPAANLHEVQNIELPALSGSIDHMAADVARAQLFVAAAEDHSVETVDLKAGRLVSRVTGLKQPRRVAVIPLTADIRRQALLSPMSGIPEAQDLMVTDKSDLHADVFDGVTFLPIKRIEIDQNQSDIQFDARVGRAYIGAQSSGDSSIAVIDESYVKVQQIRISAPPASFRLEDNGKRIFVNLPTLGTVAVVDRTLGQEIALWRLAARGNLAMALDEAHQRLFIATQDPAKLFVLDTQTGRTIATLDCVGDVEDISYAPDSGLVYVSGGDGFLDVFQQISPDEYELVHKVPTEKGARTSLYVPQWHRLFVAIPGKQGVHPQIRVYEAD